jgi:hypothetical protein
MIDLLLAVGILLLGVGLGIGVMRWYIQRRINKMLAGELNFLKLLDEVKE